MNAKKQLFQNMQQNRQVIVMYDADQIIKEWEFKTKKTIKSILKGVSGNMSTILDVITATRVMKDLGLTGKVKLSRIKGKTYIIFKGNNKLRSVFRGTRYLSTNPKIVNMAIGPRGVVRSVRNGTLLTFVLFVPVDIYLHFMKNNKIILSELLGELSVDLVKVGIASICAAIAGIIAGGLTTLAAGPLIVAIAVSVLVNWALDTIDEKTGIGKGVVEAYKKAGIDLNQSWSSFQRLFIKDNRNFQIEWLEQLYRRGTF